MDSPRLFCISGLFLTFLAIFFLTPGTSRLEKNFEASKKRKMGFGFHEDKIAGGKKFFAHQDGDPIPYMTAMTLLQNSKEFREQVIEVLKTGVDHEAYFFETPGVTYESANLAPFEFILNDATSLAHVSPDTFAFQEYFQDCDETGIVSFMNLGKDALLVAPCPVNKNKGEEKNYTHLATFVRNGNSEQVDAFWKKVGEKMKTRLEQNRSRTIWLSTSGLGIYWLHMRLDTYPKYYTYPPYKRPAGH